MALDQDRLRDRPLDHRIVEVDRARSAPGQADQAEQGGDP
jgi:hypothetical protein